jgi:hypothetical protein
MQSLIESIRNAVAETATAEQKAAGVLACRSVLAALDATPGQPLMLAGAPAQSPLAALDPGQALDLLIARLRAALPVEGPGSHANAAEPSGVRIAFVPPVNRT